MSLRIALWDQVLDGVRAYFHQEKLQEVSTTIRVQAPSIEPYIEPIACSGKWLATSPELAMKRLLCEGSGSIFQIAHVFRQGEQGEQHREEFHLIEWYRVSAAIRHVQRDVEELVGCAIEVARSLGCTPRFSYDRTAPWSRRSFLDLVEETTGLTLKGDEDAAQLRFKISAKGVSCLCPAPLEAEVPSNHFPNHDARTRQLHAWTQFFTLWADLRLDPWMAEQAYDRQALHLEEFPAPLAALSVVEGCIAQRFESYFGGVEIANGYQELRNPVEQRLRFDRVNRLRQCIGIDRLPIDESFIAHLKYPGLPQCCGVALGLERLLVLASGQRILSDVLL